MFSQYNIMICSKWKESIRFLTINNDLNPISQNIFVKNVV